MNHRLGRLVFAAVVGLLVAWFAFGWITDPVPREQRQAEEKAVLAARDVLRREVGVGNLEIVDPLAPNRKVGKVYVYAEPPGWAVSGYYSRGEGDRWHPFLLQLDAGLALRSFKADDDALGTK